MEKARQAAEKARELQPDAGETFLARGYYEYIVVRDYDAAWSAFKEGVLRLPNNADALLSLSFIERRKGRWAEAVAHQEQAARLDPQSVPVLSQLGVTYFALKRFTDAHTIVDRLLGLAPENPQVLAGLARLDLAEGNLEAAETAMRSVAAGAKQRLRFRDPGAARADCRPSRRGNSVDRKCLRANDRRRPVFSRANIDTSLGSPKSWLATTLARARLMKQLARSWRKLSKRSPNRPRPSCIWRSLRPGWPTKRRPLPPPKKRSLSGRSLDAVASASFEEALARIKARFGENDAAIADFRRLLATNYLGPEQIALTPALLRLDPAWMSLRNDPRFEKIVASLAPKNSSKK